MKKINLKKTLVQKIKDFDIIIFDLDNTLYSEDNYITPALMEVSKYLKNSCTGIPLIVNSYEPSLISVFNLLLFNFCVCIFLY